MLLLYLLVFYLAINLAGWLIEKVKIPRIYAALFLGILLGTTSWVKQFVGFSAVTWLSQLGMITLLFLLGFGLNLKTIRRQSRLIVRITTLVISFEFVVGSLILHYYFQVAWGLSGLIALSFATVGEIALLPILKEFNLIKTHLGQTIFGVAILDDLVEMLSFVLLVIFFDGFSGGDFLIELLPVLAIGAGLAVGNSLKHSKKFGLWINRLALFVLGPFFFFTAGTEADLKLLLSKLPVILAFTLAIKATKLISAYLAAHRQLGFKKSLVLGISLGIKFSTSIIILIILLQKQLISETLFSILIGIKVTFKIIVPILLSILLPRWHLELAKPAESD